MDGRKPDHAGAVYFPVLSIDHHDPLATQLHDGIAGGEPDRHLPSPRDRLRTAHAEGSRAHIRQTPATPATLTRRPGASRATDWTAVNDFPIPAEARLQDLFGLTRAEVRLAQGLARGESLEEVALSLNIRMTTARTQLAAIFAKTDTRRQAKLVAILSRIAHLG